ncbi:CLUMA_CG007412, isoform A [Clunio marinus]|uniref:CLUMA_CG007412, isoform A n=1 Tax=Clunio marinus TaxID=568069 RepID=A0A1J1I0T8_9DIPT|nr:CLUMA_CG007412, isoform A [Clunio marinus]
MSLFKVLKWFDYQCSDYDENYDAFLLTCCKLHSNDNNNKDIIIVASHDGHLTILQPSQQESTSEDKSVDVHNNPQNPSSVIFEKNLNEPVIGVLSGNFFQTRNVANQCCIAILHPRKIAFYSLLTTAGLVEHGLQSKLQLMNKFEFQKTAFCFVKGGFGNVKNKDFLCIMFLDGSLRFFEHDGIEQNCTLPGIRTIPTSFIYVERTDCFLFLSPNWDLECFRYLNMSETFERKFSPIWSINVGEYILDMNSHQTSNSESLIILLGENNLICVSDTGKMKFIKKMDYTPLCFCSFVVGWYFEPDCKLMIAVATENNSILIYQNSTLVWCAELLEQAVAIRRGNFFGIAGGLVTLSPTGKVTVGFLGSEPVLNKVPPINLSKLDYDKSKIELEEMEKEIHESVDNADVPFINASAEKDLNIQTQLTVESKEIGHVYSLRIILLPTLNLEQVQVHLNPNIEMINSENVFMVKNLISSNEYSLDTSFTLENSASLEIFDEILLLISFINKQGISRVIRKVVKVPLSKVFQPCLPQNDEIYKVTLSSEHPINFNAMLSDFNLQNIKQSFGLKATISDSNLTMVLAKNTNRYRLQSNSLIVLKSFLKALSNYNEESKALQTTAISAKIKSIPVSIMEILMTVIEKHHNLREEMKGIMDTLNTKTIELKFFERCFLAKIHGKSATSSIDNVHELLTDTYQDILSLTTKAEIIRNEIKIVQSQLCATLCFLREVVGFMSRNDSTKSIMDGILLMTRCMFTDFHEQSQIEALAPYVENLYNINQMKKSENNFHQKSFSLPRFIKHLKSTLSILSSENAVSDEILLNVKESLNEDNENVEEEKDWNATIKSII